MTEKNSDKIRLHTRFIKSCIKNTLAVFFSFSLSFMLMTAMLVLLHTNHRIANIQDKTLFTPSDCYIKDLSWQQIGKLKKDEDIKHLAVGQEVNDTFKRNNQTLFLSKGDDAFITMTATVIEGKLPEGEDEIAAEKWSLLNLGIEPSVNQTFTVYNGDTEETKEFRLVGILSDMPINKKYGTIQIYTSPDYNLDQSHYTAYLRLKEDINYDKKMKSLKTELEIENKQVKECPARENFKQLYETDVKIISVILVICMVVFYGIYRIAAITRERQYGILRAVGMKKKQLKKMIMLELWQIYCVSVPVGIGIGLLTAFFIITISGDNKTDIYLYNEKVEFVPVVPVLQIIICVIATAVLAGFVGYMTGRKAVKSSIIETVSGISSEKIESKSRFGFKKSGSKIGTLFQMGCKYIFRDVKTSSFVILTICLGVTLFTGLAYRVQILKLYREDTKEMWYLNGQYTMSMLRIGSTEQGISRQNKARIEDIEGITSVKTASGMPVRVIDEDNIKRNDAYYDEMNEKLKEIYGYGEAGYDGSNQVYKSLLYGYNEAALKELKKYVISGDYNPDFIGDNEIILSVLRTDDTKENDLPGSYKEGTPLMEYNAGDEIQIKYRADFHTDSAAYEEFTDSEEEYIYKTYKIAAIVSFPYMYDCNRTVYPLLITSDRQMHRISDKSCIQNMYVDGKRGMSLREQIDLEQKLIQICNQDSDISTRSMISEIEENEMFYRKQMIYVEGIAIVAFVLVMINMINNLRYRMQIRTREISMLRAIGMSVAMAKKMLMFENLILGGVAVVVAYFLSVPVLKYLYQLSDMKAFGHSFQYNYWAYIAVSAGALIICALLSFGILKSWKTKRITEGIGNIE